MGDLQCSCYSTKTRIKAVIFDLDGTLLNTEQGTKGILKEFLARYGKVLDVEKENRRVGMIWKESVNATIKDYDLPLTIDQYVQEITPLYQGMWMKAKPLPGANRLLKHLHKHGVPLALASNSLRKNIETKICRQEGWKDYFIVILGSDQVKSGKPAPDMFLEVAKQMAVEPQDCLVIEDSLVGVKAGKTAGMKVVAVPSLQNERDKFSIADSVLHSMLQFEPEVWGLPLFEDWVCNALPMEPFYVKGVFSNGLLHELSDDEPYLPDQLQGVYFGWARIDEQKIVKILISIAWEHKCCSSSRKIQAFMINASNGNVYNQDIELLVVGYIRGSSYKVIQLKGFDITNKIVEGKENDLDILEDDKSIADAALDLAEYLDDSCKSFFPELQLKDNASAKEQIISSIW